MSGFWQERMAPPVWSEPTNPIESGLYNNTITGYYEMWYKPPAKDISLLLISRSDLPVTMLLDILKQMTWVWDDDRIIDPAITLH